MSIPWSILATIALGVLLLWALSRFGAAHVTLLFKRLGLTARHPAKVHGGSPLTLPLEFGVKLLATVLVGLLLTMINLNSALDALAPGYFWESYMAVSALSAWTISYVWTYALSLDGARLSIPTWAFGVRELDLRKLVHVEDKGAYVLRLHFEDGSRAGVMKHIERRPEFMAALARFRDMARL
ncbi:MAG: hypothetical protein AAFR53_03955 [Pseudomonadota bacterium]